jgi:hypothetical protein
MARSAEELFTDLATELMFGVRLGSQDDLADVGCRYDTEVASQCALPPPYRAATLIGTTIPSPVSAFWGGRVDPRAVHRTEQVFCVRRRRSAPTDRCRYTRDGRLVSLRGERNERTQGARLESIRPTPHEESATMAAEAYASSEPIASATCLQG